MLKNLNIAKLLKLLVLILPMVLVLTSCSIDETQSTNKQAAISGTDDPNQIANAHRGCWQTAITDQLYDTMSKAAMQMYTKITNGALTFMMVAFAVWFSFRLLKHLSSVMEENAAEVWTEVLRKLFLCFALGTIASSGDYVIFFLNKAVFPIYNAFLEFGSEILVGTVKSKDLTLTIFGESVTWKSQDIICKFDSKNIETVGAAFPQSPKVMMGCLVCSVNERMSIGIKMAATVLQDNGFMVILVGLLLMFCFTMVKLGFVFYLVDSIFKFTIVAIILPLLIMSYAFEPTKKWFNWGFLAILNSAAFMMFIAVMVTMALLAVEEVIINNPSVFNSDDKNSFKQLSVPVLCLLMICVLIVSSVEIAQQVTNSLVGGGTDSKFQKKLKAVVQTVAGWVGGFLTAGVSKTISGVYEKIQEVKKNVGKSAGSQSGKALEALKKVNSATDKLAGNKD